MKCKAISGIKFTVYNPDLKSQKIKDNIFHFLEDYTNFLISAFEQLERIISELLKKLK